MDISADYDDGIPEPVTEGRVSRKLMPILDFTDAWVKNPDYQRVSHGVMFEDLIGYNWVSAGRLVIGI